LDLSTLSLKERLARYRESAEQARREAAAAQSSERQAFMDIAEGWLRLARLAEQQIAKDDGE
jgi:hypothetical protein